jgi:pilus assembly protein CpaB
MKWSVVGLLALGLIAALCAAILVAGLSGGGSLQAKNNQQAMDADQPIRILVAGKKLPAMTVLDATCVESLDTTRGKAPANALTSTVEVVGKVLGVGMEQGQAYTKNCLVSEGSGTHMAALIPKGKRASGIAVTNYAALDGVLYPGAIVDVLGSFRATGNAGQSDYREPLSVTLLEGVQVLAIEKNTVVSQDERKDESESITSRGASARRVTLLVTAQQAKILQLAMEQGSLALALRNPLDLDVASKEGVALSRLLSEDETPTRMAFEDALKRMRSHDTATTMPAIGASMQQQRWDTVIMRGGASETVHFAVTSEGNKGS